MEALSSYFLNIPGFWTALVLFPFFLIYFIRPKPIRETVPSLLFVMKDMGRTNINSFFHTFLRDFLVLLQLLILLVLIAAAARPYVELPRSYLVEQTIIVLDDSASMHASDGQRFEEALSLAEENLGKETTIILVKGTSDILVERASTRVAKDALEILKPTETTTDLSGALQLASGYATTGSRVVIISDFLATAGDRDFQTQADALRATGAIVEYLPVTAGRNNVGIIDLSVGPVTSSVWLKNANDRPVQVTLKISDAEQEVLLAKGETKEITFNTPAGVAEIAIKQDDDLLVDNKAWTSAPTKNTIKVLIITNSKSAVERSNLLLAMNVITKNFPTDFEIDYAEPPKVPSLDYDVYIIDNVNLDLILPGYVKGIRERVEQGASLVVFSQPDLFKLDWQGLLPVTALEESAGDRAGIIPEQLTSLTQDIEFGQVSSYLRVADIPGATVVAKTPLDPVIVLHQKGKGRVLYYGLDDAKTTFSKNPSYPVFWRRVFDLLTDRPSLENLNRRTGSVLNLPKVSRVKTPHGTITTNLVPLEYAGLYILPDRTVAVNLLSDGESQIAASGNVSFSDASVGASGIEKAPRDVSDYALWIAIGLLFLELLYLKYRGDV